MRPENARRFVILFALALAWGAAASGPGAANTPAGAGATQIASVLAALDRVVNVEFGNASPRVAFGELSRVGGVAIDLDPAVRGDIAINAILKGVRLGDALSMLCRNCGLRLLPGNGRLVVAPVPAITVIGGLTVIAVPTPVSTDPWGGWVELTGLPLAPAGETGYPRVSAIHVVPAGGLFTPELVCAYCRGPVQASWAFCPRCGKQRLPYSPEMKYCWGCGRANTTALMAPASTPLLTAPATARPPIRLRNR